MALNLLWQPVVLLVRAVPTGRYLPYALIAPALLAWGLAFNRALDQFKYRWLDWSPFGVRTNVALAPIRWRWVWLPYTALLAFLMPFLALLEELVFRAGTTNWVRGLLWGALAFGLAHFTSLVSVRMVIYLTLVGALLVDAYMVGGLLACFVLHAVYNWIALGVVVATRNRQTRAAT